MKARGGQQQPGLFLEASSPWRMSSCWSWSCQRRPSWASRSRQIGRTKGSSDDIQFQGSQMLVRVDKGAAAVVGV